MTHGTRACYVSGCRCFPCRCANAGYEAHRRHQGRIRWIDAGPVKAHLETLRQAGVGLRQIADRAHCSRSLLQAICTNQQSKLRESTAARILAVTPNRMALGSLINAWRTKRLLRVLLGEKGAKRDSKGEGYTRRNLAVRLGLRGGQLRKHSERVRLSTALRVQRVYRELTAES